MALTRSLMSGIRGSYAQQSTFSDKSRVNRSTEIVGLAMYQETKTLSARLELPAVGHEQTVKV